MKQNLPIQFDQADMTNIPRAFHSPAVNGPVHLTHKLGNSLWSFLELREQSDESFRLRLGFALLAPTLRAECPLWVKSRHLHCTSPRRTRFRPPAFAHLVLLAGKPSKVKRSILFYAREDEARDAEQIPIASDHTPTNSNTARRGHSLDEII